MGARSLRIMAFGHEANPGGSHAPAPSYAEPTTGPSLRHPAPAATRPAPRLQTEGHRPDPLGGPADRRRGGDLDPRRLWAAGRPGFRGDPPQGPLRRPARVRRTPAAAQQRLGRTAAPGIAPPAPAAGARPYLDAVSRRTLPRPRGGLPRPGQGRYQPLPRLRHRLRPLPGPAVHRRPDGGRQGGAAQGGAPAPPEAGPRGRGQAAAPAAGPGLLQRGRDPLPPGGAIPVPDAGGPPGPQGRPPAGPERHPGLRAREAERLVRVHGDRWCETDGTGVNLRGLPQLPWEVEAARPPGAGLRLLGGDGSLLRVGAGDVPVAVRDREQLPADEPGAWPDVDAAAGAAAVVCGGGIGAAQPVGVAALRGAVDATPRRAGDPAGAAAAADDVALAAPGDRRGVRDDRRHADGKASMFRTSVLADRRD